MFFDLIKNSVLIFCLFFPIISQANHSKQYYTVDGYSMYVDIDGKGKPAVIFEAGLGWDSPTWKDVKGLILIDSVGQNDPFQDSLPDSSAPYVLEAKGVSISKEQVREAGVGGQL